MTRPRVRVYKSDAQPEYTLKIWCRRDVPAHRYASSGRRKCAIGTLAYYTPMFSKRIIRAYRDVPLRFEDFETLYLKTHPRPPEAGLEDSWEKRSASMRARNKHAKVLANAYVQTVETEYDYFLPLWYWQRHDSHIENIRTRYKSKEARQTAEAEYNYRVYLPLTHGLRVPRCTVCETEYNLDLRNQDVLALLKRKAVEGQRRTNIAELMRAQYKVAELRRMFPNGDYPREILEAHPIMPELLAR